MNLIVDLNTEGVMVNCGKAMLVSYIPVEVLSPSISKHGDDIVNAYYMEGDTKIEVSYHGKDTFCIYKFKGKHSSSHYWSRSYDIDEAPNKFKEIVEELISIHKILTINNTFKEAI